MSNHQQIDVLIIGGGIGGLCLAHGLRAAGVGVRVFERTHERTDWLQGYRIHIDPHGATALHDCLPPAAWDRFLATVSDEATGFAFRTETLAPLLDIPDAIGTDPDPACRHHGIARTDLREALLTDLDDVVEHGRCFTRYEIGADGRVTAHFEDGTSAVGDVLVGADGGRSRVRAQLLPGTGRRDTGVVTVAGKHPLDGADLPDVLTRGVLNVVPARRGSLFSAVWRGDRAGDAPVGDYVFWGYTEPAAAFPPVEAWPSLDGGAWRDLVAQRVAGWAPALHRLVAGSEASTVNPLQIRSADPVTAADLQPTGPVTLLGDAIHAMTPMAGIGANTALRDAALLSRVLGDVARGERALRDAVAGYEREMLTYGFAAVAQSLRNARLAGSTSRVQRGLLRTVLRTVDHIPAAKRRMLAG